jgi:poly [ADP-ribose] polymerase 2/3/4
MYELCQLIRDMISVNEATNWNMRSTIESKYRSIGSHIKCLSDQKEYAQIRDYVLKSFEDDKQQLLIGQENNNVSLNILNIYQIVRNGENQNFKSEINNQKLLFHGSKVKNFIGLLSRGLLLPKYSVNDVGALRSDVGLLGAGIYFSDSIKTSLKYSQTSQIRNSRLVALCDVALGNVKQVYKHDTNLTEPPSGYQSVNGVKNDGTNESEFNDNEYVIYNANQQRIRYIVELNVDSVDEPLKDVIARSSEMNDNSLGPIEQRLNHFEDGNISLTNKKDDHFILTVL